MKKSMIIMSIAAMVAMYFPVAASEADKNPPVTQEIRIVNKADLVKEDASEVPKEVTPVTSENGNENTSSDSAHSGYIIISSAGLILLIILLILLL